ncbi:MAG: LytTR family transcriptional regulator [Clostridia bacterium]|nr:LytTR family transcriptional regulator [Clostridia bacterium]
MKLKIEIDPERDEEIVIRAKEITPELKRLQDAVTKALSGSDELVVRSGDAECFIPVGEIIFAETSGEKLWVHTAKDVFACPLRLRELEELLPRSFVRASKSSIVNSSHVRSLSRSPTGVGEASFPGTGKKIFISRMYFKNLRDTIEETRLKK